MATVSVIICAHTEQRYNDILDAVASVQRQTVLPQELIVVIDHNPALLERLQKQLGSTVHLLENKYERGLSGARNTGIEFATGEILVFMDDDAAAASNNWMALLLAEFDDPTVAGVGGGIDPNWIGGRPRWFPSEFQWVVGCTYVGMPTTITPVRNLIGANMSFRRSVFDVAGLFRDGMGRVGSLPVGCEETEICIRYRQKMRDHNFLFVPAARVTHNVPNQRGTWGYFWSRCYHEGRSKAQVVQMVGAGDGLASERAYTMKILPQGVLNGLRDAIFKLDVSGLGRAAAIISGLFITGTGYLYGKYETFKSRTQPHVVESSS
jgi:glucosyl-dolichyl phosphate glucuronosyltransferase